MEELQRFGLYEGSRLQGALDSGIDFETIGPLGGHCAVSAFGAPGPPEGLNLLHDDAVVGFSKSKTTQKPFTLYS